MKLIGIGLVHTKSGILPKAVQKFQMRSDKESGYYNHSMIIFEQDGERYVLEASNKDFDENKGKLKNAGAYINPLSIYLKDNYEVLLLKPTFNVSNVSRAIYKWEGTPYDFHNLLGDQIIQYLFGWWWGRNGRAARKLMVCHELTMTVMNEFADFFKYPNRARVADIYHSAYFTHERLWV